MRVFTTGHTKEEAEKWLKGIWRFGLFMEVAAILFLCFAWAVRDWWFFAYGCVCLFITGVVHIQVHLTSIDLKVADNKSHRKEATK